MNQAAYRFHRNSSAVRPFALAAFTIAGVLASGGTEAQNPSNRALDDYAAAAAKAPANVSPQKVIGQSSGGAAQSGKTIVVTVGNAGGKPTFTPQSISILVGDTVTWEFGIGVHSVASGSFEKPCTPDNRFFSGLMTGASSDKVPPRFSHTFKAAGVYPYYCSTGRHCQIGHVGWIEVRPKP